ncbi:MAG: AAA family ATPase [Nitrososphaerota archaeon]|nr:AAA family ATPase [Nitrososphaerota archaeon]
MPDSSDQSGGASYKSEGPNARLTVSISLKRKIGKEKLKEKYGVTRYDLADGYAMPESLRPLVPKDTPEYVDRGHNYVERIMRSLYHFKQCALIGPSGTGKTHVVYLVSEIAGLPLWEINCGLQTSVYDMFGRFVGLGRENWVDGQIVSWCRYGGILYLDEANMMKQDVATRLNPLLDTRGHMVLTEKDNEVIPRHPQGYVVISMNPYSAEFAGTKPLNAAFRRRMSVWIDFDYLSVGGTIAKDEVEMVSRRSHAPLDVSERIVRVGAEIRRRYKAGDLPYGPSVGDLVNWATLVADNMDPALAAEETIVSLTSDDVEVQTTVRRIVRMILGGGRGAARWGYWTTPGTPLPASPRRAASRSR